MQIDLVRRFAIRLNPTHEKFDSIMMVATLLHLTLRRASTEEERYMAVRSVVHNSNEWYPTNNQQSAMELNEGK